MQSNKRSIAIELENISKQYGAVFANSNITLKVEAGSIHAIVGENGAGKSTLLKILYGLVKPDTGEIKINGELKKWKSPLDAVAGGLGMVHQHFMLAFPHTALDNILLGVEPLSSRFWFLPKSIRPIARAEARRQLQTLCTEYGFEIPLDEKIENLSVGVQQRIEIVKLLYRNVKILILDEPTAVLTPAETLDLFRQLKLLKAQGKTILMVTHKLKEVLEVADRVTVIRNGKSVASAEISGLTVERLAEWMVGRPLQKIGHQPFRSKNKEVIRPVLEIPELGIKLYPGQILGIAGVEGNGQSTLIDQIFRIKEPPPRDRVFSEANLFSQRLGSLTAQKVRDLGACLIAEDRHRQGLLLNRSVWENFILGQESHLQFSFRIGFRWLKIRNIIKVLDQVFQDFEIRPAQAHLVVSAYSGGNQQKLIVARELYQSPKFLCAAQPTRGVDVGAIELIHKKILEQKAKGLAVLLISSELEELLTLSDQIAVMVRRKIVGRFERETEHLTFDVDKIGLALGGKES